MLIEAKEIMEEGTENWYIAQGVQLSKLSIGKVYDIITKNEDMMRNTWEDLDLGIRASKER